MPDHISEENKPIEKQPILGSTYAFLKKSYPLDDPKRVTKEVMIGAPSFLAGYAMNAAINKAGSSLFPSIAAYKTPVVTTPQQPPAWHRYVPLNYMVKNNWVSRDAAIRFHAPISEELVFRGLLMPGMQKGLEASGVPEKPAKIASMIGNSLLYSALNPKVYRKAFFLNSLVYSALTHYADDSLIPATAAHMANNQAALSLAKAVTRK